MSTLTYIGGHPPKFDTIEQAEAWMRGVLVPVTYRLLIVDPQEPVDIGDWLPQDEEHYNRVGPFQLQDDTGAWHPVDWQQWWNQPDGRANVGNWNTYGARLERHCAACDSWSHTRESLWGLDYFCSDRAAPYDGQVIDLSDPPSTIDPYLLEVGADLISQDLYSRRQKDTT